MTDGGKAERQHQARLPSDKKISKSAIMSQWWLSRLSLYSEHLIFGQDEMTSCAMKTRYNLILTIYSDVFSCFILKLCKTLVYALQLKVKQSFREPKRTDVNDFKNWDHGHF